MKPKSALGLFAVLTLVVVAVFASAMAQDYKPSPAGRPSRNDPLTLPTLPSDDVRPGDPYRPSTAPAPGPSSDSILTRRPSEKPADWLPRKIGPEEADLVRKVGPEEAQLVLQTNELIRQLEADGSEAQHADAKAKLSDLLGKQFDARQKRHEREIEALEAQVKKLKELARKRQENRAEIISRKLDQIVRDSQGLGF